MGGFKNEVFGAVDNFTLFLSVATPEEENEGGFEFREDLNGGIGELFPAFVLVGAGVASTDGESGIEEKNALLGPMIKIASFGDRLT